MANFFKQPVGAAVLYLNDFHNGKYLNELNRAARLVPSDVKGMASLTAMSDYADASMVEAVIQNLTQWADGVDELNQVH
jgi:predicted transcriptional regulator with HTH domain